MNVTSISTMSLSLTLSLQGAGRGSQGASGTAQNSAQQAGGMPPPPPGSAPAQLMESLRQIQSTDPDKFKQLTAEISDQLAAAADELGSDPTANLLQDLSGKFEQASQGGDLSAFGPPPPPPPGGGAPGQGAPAAGPVGLSGQLTQLSSQNPDLFSQLLDSVVAGLETASQNTQNQTVSALLSDLAQAFSRVSDSGSLASAGMPKNVPPPMQNGMSAYQQQGPGGIDNAAVERVFTKILDNLA